VIRLSELKLPLSALPVEERRAADAPAETEADRQLPPHPIDALRTLAAEALGISTDAIATLDVFKRSFDARKADILAVFIVDVQVAPASEVVLLAQHANHAHIALTPDMAYQPAAHAPANFDKRQEGERPVVVGFGPCGIFAALSLAQMGFKPIVIERGSPVRQRTKDTWGLWRKKILNVESNVQFGEGGAGTFSDGKLYSQIKDPRFLGRKVMHEFVQAGAPAEILFAAHPHIGTFKLVKVVEGLREQIIRLGGEVRFEQRVVDIDYEDTGVEYDDQRQLQALRIHNHATDETYTLPTRHAVMALGHSSRDTFTMLHRHAVAMEAKPFSVGVRIEHPQGVIDRARWGRHAGHPMLGAADYKLVHHAENGRSVYSFCMCPGGTVVAATSEPGRVVTNGMSQYSRNERNANSAIVVGISPEDYPGGPLAGIDFQRRLESQAYVMGGSDYNAPGQLVGDFIAKRPSREFGSVQPSYKPGVTLGELDASLPDYAIAAIREALPAFDRQIRGYAMQDAVLTGVETRTSSPIRIKRGLDFQSINTKGLYPAGEGAGYAGGILSAGVDGIKVAEAVARSLVGGG